MSLRESVNRSNVLGGQSFEAKALLAHMGVGWVSQKGMVLLGSLSSSGEK